MTTYLVNAMSLGMLTVSSGILGFQTLTLDEAKALAKDAVPAIGHQDTANLVQDALGLDTSPMARISLTFEPGDTLLVAQYKGPRLPEGTRVLPEGATIGWMCVAHH